MIEQLLLPKLVLIGGRCLARLLRQAGKHADHAFRALGVGLAAMLVANLHVS